MRNRELKKLNRKELLEIVLEQSRQLEMLEAEGRIADIPALEEELKRENYRKRYGRTLRSTIYMLITVAAVAPSILKILDLVFGLFMVILLYLYYNCTYGK